MTVKLLEGKEEFILHVIPSSLLSIPIPKLPGKALED
jgi:hypothetical protein